MPSETKEPDNLNDGPTQFLIGIRTAEIGKKKFFKAIQKGVGEEERKFFEVDMGEGAPPDAQGLSWDELIQLLPFDDEEAAPLETAQGGCSLADFDFMGKCQEMMEDRKKIIFKGMVSLCQDNIAVARLMLKEIVCPIPVQAVIAFLGRCTHSLGIPNKEIIQEIEKIIQKFWRFKDDDTRSIKILNKEALLAYIEKPLPQFMDPKQIPTIFRSMMTGGTKAFKEMFSQQFANLSAKSLVDQGLITFISKGEADAEVVRLLQPLTQADAPLPKNQEILQFLKVPTDHPHYDTMVHDPDFGVEYSLACFKECTTPELTETFYKADNHIDQQMELKAKQDDAKKYENYANLLGLMTKHYFAEGADRFIANTKKTLLANYGERIG